MKLKAAQKLRLLRAAGFDVDVRHSRYYPGRLLPRTAPIPGVAPMPRGGFTAVIIEQDGAVIGTGLALCHQEDNFNKKIGLEIALGRAMKSSALEV